METGDQKMENENEVVKWFEANGWREFPVASHDRHDRNWVKKYTNEPRCHANREKSLQLVAKMWRREWAGDGQVGLEIELHAQPSQDGAWTLFMAHAFDLVEDVPLQCERLLTAWRAIVQPSPADTPTVT